MKRFAIALVGLVVFTPSPSARADGEAQSGGGDIPGLLLSEEQNKCLDQCLTGQAPVCPAATSCPPAPKCEAALKVVPPKPVRRAAQRVRVKLQEKKDKVQLIQQQIPVAQTANPPCPECVESLRRELSELKTEVETLNGEAAKIAALGGLLGLGKDVTNLKLEVNNFKSQVTNIIADLGPLREQVAKNTEEIKELKVTKMKRFTVAPKLRFLYLQPLDGDSSLVGGSVGAEVRWQFKPGWWLGVESGLIISQGKDGQAAYSTLVMGGFTYEFAQRWGVSLGAVGFWTQLDHELLSKWIGAGAYGALSLRIVHGLTVELDFLATGKFGDKSPTFLPGATLGLMYRF